MENQEDGQMHECGEKILRIFSEFMTSIVKFEELSSVGNKLLVGFQQGLEYVQRPRIEKYSDLVESIIKANETKRLASYIEAGCKNTNDSIQNINKLHTCHNGLQDHKNKAKCLVDELGHLLDETVAIVQSAKYNLACALDRDINSDSDSETTLTERSSIISSETLKEVAMVMAVVCSMVKKDYEMQEKIISSLNLKSSMGELETYCLMWSLRPFVDDEIMQRAWKLVH